MLVSVNVNCSGLFTPSEGSCRELGRNPGSGSCCVVFGGKKYKMSLNTNIAASLRSQTYAKRISNLLWNGCKLKQKFNLHALPFPCVLCLFLSFSIYWPTFEIVNDFSPFTSSLLTIYCLFNLTGHFCVQDFSNLSKQHLIFISLHVSFKRRPFARNFNISSLKFLQLLDPFGFLTWTINTYCITDFRQT